MKLAIIFNHDKILGKLTKYFTGCYAFHVAWVDLETDTVYDTNLYRRKRSWSGLYKEDQFLLFDVPKVKRDYLEYRLNFDLSSCTLLDLIQFYSRRVYHLLGISTYNIGGVTSADMCNTDIWECGGSTPFDLDKTPPSPCDLFNWLRSRDASENKL